MRSTARFSSRLRDSSALVITAALHLGVAAIALVAVTIVAPKPKPPIVTRAIPDTIVPPPPLPDVRIPEVPVPATVKAPIVVIADPMPPEPWPEIRPGEPIVLDPGPIATPGKTAEPPARPMGPSRGARFDPRHASDAQPPYPAAARRLGEEGSVVVHVTIGRDGRVTAASIAASSGSPRLDAAALEQALKRWRFTPALADGAPVEAARDITVRFRLADA